MLSKWYMDCVAGDGTVFMGYSGTVRWRSLSLGYASIMTYPNDPGSPARFSLRDNPPPQNEGGTLLWNVPRFGLEGIWRSVVPPVHLDMLRTEIGSIGWHCTQPMAAAEVAIGPIRHFKGYGYAENLLVSIKPWQIPINVLRWGRFISDKDSVVWIDWKGSEPRTWVFHNGMKYVEACVGDKSVLFGGLTLSLDDPVAIREGPIIRGAFGKLPLPLECLPVRALRARECKWRSRGRLFRSGLLSDGWALHEVVTI